MISFNSTFMTFHYLPYNFKRFKVLKNIGIQYWKKKYLLFKYCSYSTTLSVTSNSKIFCGGRCWKTGHKSDGGSGAVELFEQNDENILSGRYTRIYNNIILIIRTIIPVETVFWQIECYQRATQVLLLPCTAKNLDRINNNHPSLLLLSSLLIFIMFSVYSMRIMLLCCCCCYVGV